MNQETKAGEIQKAKAAINTALRYLKLASEKIELAEREKKNSVIMLDDASTIVRGVYCKYLPEADRALVAIHSGLHCRSVVTFEIKPAALAGEIEVWNQPDPHRIA